MTVSKKLKCLVPVLLMLVSISGCSKPSTLTAVIVPLRDTNISGLISFEDIGEKNVKMRYFLQGLQPGYHALHIHEKGDCSGKDGKTTGKHLRRDGQIHGFPSKAMNHHTGDLPELFADKDGISFGEFILPDLDLYYAEDSLIGRGMMVHLNPDHFGPEKRPNKRVACGVLVEALEPIGPSF